MPAGRLQLIRAASPAKDLVPLSSFLWYDNSKTTTIETIKGGFMETRVALLSIIVRDTAAAEKLNEILHKYGEYIIGRMGLPYREKGIHIISVALDAPPDIINALAGKIGKIPEISSKVVYANE